MKIGKVVKTVTSPERRVQKANQIPVSIPKKDNDWEIRKDYIGKKKIEVPVTGS